MKFNAVIKNEQLKINRTYIIPLSVFLLNTILAIIVFIYFFNINNTARVKSTINYLDIIKVKNYVTYAHMFIIAAILPYISSNSICSDKQGEGLYIIFLSGIKRFEYVLGKVISHIFTTLLIIATTYPIYITTHIFGGFDIENNIIYLSFIFLNVVFVASVCNFISSICTETNTSQILSYLISIAAEIIVFILSMYVFKSNNSILVVINIILLFLGICFFIFTCRSLSGYCLSKGGSLES